MSADQTPRQSESAPPASVTLRHCAGCGRDDRLNTLKDKHYAAGRLCPGTVRSITYWIVGEEV